jgi:hypothetical protein
MSEKKLTPEELLELPETKKLLDNYSDEEGIRHKIKYDLARSKNYKRNIYYHATGGLGEAGVGKGLYLGKDRRALNNFYNCDGEIGSIELYKGNPRFIDLSVYRDYDDFKKKAIKKYGKMKYNEHLKRLTLAKRYDGIRYYDPIATGEEFVLYNIKKVKLIHLKSMNKRKYLEPAL